MSDHQEMMKRKFHSNNVEVMEGIKVKDTAKRAIVTVIAVSYTHLIGTVERALAIFQQLGLVEQLDCGLLYMTDIELMKIGRAHV